MLKNEAQLLVIHIYKDVRVASWVAERLKIWDLRKLENITKISKPHIIIA